MHAGDVPSEYILERRKDLLHSIFKSSQEDASDSARVGNTEIINSFRKHLINYMKLTDAQLFNEFAHSAWLASVRDNAPEVVRLIGMHEFTEEMGTVLTAEMFTYYAATTYFYDHTPITPRPSIKPRVFFPANADAVNREVLLAGRQAILALGRKEYAEIEVSWEPLFDDPAQLFGGEEYRRYAEAGIGYAASRLNDIHKHEIESLNQIMNITQLHSDDIWRALDSEL